MIQNVKNKEEIIMEIVFYASVQFDNEYGEWEDIVFEDFTFTDLIERANFYLTRRKNSSILAAAIQHKYTKDGKPVKDEFDITNKLNQAINGNNTKPNRATNGNTSSGRETQKSEAG